MTRLLLCISAVISLSACSGSFSTLGLSIESGTVGPSVNPFSCNATDKPTFSTKIKKLNKVQYRNTVLSIFGSGITSTLDAHFNEIPDDGLNGSITKYRGEYSEAHINAFAKIADAVAKHVSGNSSNYSVIQSTCFSSSSWSTSTCTTEILNKLAKVFYRQPVANTATLKTIYDLGETKNEKLELLLAYLMQSSKFLYLVDFDINTSNLLQLSSYDLASKISYAITDSLPDAQLYALADSNAIQDIEVIRAQVERLLVTTLAQQKLDRFLNFWLSVDEAANVPVGPTAFLDGLSTTNLRAELIQEMKEYFRYIVFNQKGNYKDLMTSKVSFARSPASAAVYNHAPAPSGGQAVTGDSERMGIAMRAPMFFSSTFEKHPILRGARFRANFLCDEMPLPAPDNFNLGPDTYTDAMIMMHSNRERTDLKTSGPACIGCHRLINPVGFAFENFDTLGRFKTSEAFYRANGTLQATHNVTADGLMPPMNSYSTSISFRSPKDFIEQVANDPNAQACFSKKIFQYYNLEAEKASDNCVLSNVYQSVGSENGSIFDGIKNVVEGIKLKMSTTN